MSGKKSFMYVAPDRSAATLLPIIQTSIRPGTTITSDLLWAYGGIAAMPGMGFKQLMVKHSLHFVDPQTGAHTQRGMMMSERYYKTKWLSR